MRDPYTFRVLVTGSRNLLPGQADMVRRELFRACRWAIEQSIPVTIVQGECPYGGVDLIAKMWARQNTGVISEGWPAQFAAHGKAAGPARNAHMVGLGADICLAFPAADSRGTWDCIRKAADAGIPVCIYPLVVAA